MVPWWNRRAFGRALAIPLVSLATLTLSWYYGGESLPQWSNWVLCFVWAADAIREHLAVADVESGPEVSQ